MDYFEILFHIWAGATIVLSVPTAIAFFLEGKLLEEKTQKFLSTENSPEYEEAMEEVNNFLGHNKNVKLLPTKSLSTLLQEESSLAIEKKLNEEVKEAHQKYNQIVKELTASAKKGTHYYECTFYVGRTHYRCGSSEYKLAKRLGEAVVEIFKLKEPDLRCWLRAEVYNNRYTTKEGGLEIVKIDIHWRPKDFQELSLTEKIKNSSVCSLC